MAEASTETDLVSLVGPVAVTEFEASSDCYKPGLLEWGHELRDLADAEFETEASSAIYDSALVNSFRGNWNHEHFKATACRHEAQRRHVEAGHATDCRGETIYGRAHSRLMRDHGYIPTAAGGAPLRGGRRLTLHHRGPRYGGGLGMRPAPSPGRQRGNGRLLTVPAEGDVAEKQADGSPGHRVERQDVAGHAHCDELADQEGHPRRNLPWFLRTVSFKGTIHLKTFRKS
ncbi:hypothetical protein ABGB12_34945 [Actinocorallia sp. B10E7]|uniref:hypothetical protein n=1 Tax=Actinocorallia sp. B10E7 TaxID=3153558 RepID=UPI00325C734B